RHFDAAFDAGHLDAHVRLARRAVFDHVREEFLHCQIDGRQERPGDPLAREQTRGKREAGGKGVEAPREDPGFRRRCPEGGHTGPMRFTSTAVMSSSCGAPRPNASTAANRFAIRSAIDALPCAPTMFSTRCSPNCAPLISQYS